MRSTRKFFPGRGLSVCIGICALLLVGGLGLVAFDDSSASATFDGLPPETPRRDLPRAIDTRGVVNSRGLTVHDQIQVGDFIVVVGDFTAVETRDGRLLETSGAYAYDINTGGLLESFLPDLERSNGGTTAIRAVAGTSPGEVFIAGEFNRADGRARNRIAKYNILTGEVDTSFLPDFNAVVTELAYDDGRLFAGGEFTTVNGISRSRLARVNPDNGGLFNSFNFPITETQAAGGTSAFGPRFIGVTPDDVLVVVHRGQRVAGQSRPGIALIDLNSNSLLGYSTNYWGTDEIWTTNAALSPDGSYIVAVSTGGDFPEEGRDAGVRFDISNRNAPNQGERWVARNFDSTYAVAISDDAVFMGGHFCNVEGPNSADPFPGVGQYGNENSCFGTTPGIRFPGIVNRDQLAAFDPDTGHAFDWDPGSSAVRGVESLVVIDRGLLVGHDGMFLGRDDNAGTPRSWDVGLHGFLDIAHPNGQPPHHTCHGVRATIVGTSADDVITGTDGPDVIVSFGGNDVINGRRGVDIICGGAQADDIRGGSGADIIYGNEGGDTIFGNKGRDLIFGGPWHDLIEGGKGKDDLRGNEGDDVINGGIRADEIDGGPGEDFLRGERGDDRIEGGGSTDVIRGNKGSDSCVGNSFGQGDDTNDIITSCESR